MVDCERFFRVFFGTLPLLAPSGALVFILVYYIQASFSDFSILEQSCLYAFIIHFHFYSVFNMQNRTRQYLCMNYFDNTCMYKCLQDSTRFFRFKTQHVLYFLNVWGSMISNLTYAYILHTYGAHLAHILHT